MSFRSPARALALALIVSGCAPTLAGRLATETGEPVGGDDARVNVSSLAASPDEAPAVLVLPVDGSGRFATSAELPHGDYLVEALVPGFGIESKRVTVGGDKSDVELTLRPLGKTERRSTSANLEAPQGRGAGGASLTPPSF